MPISKVKLGSTTHDIVAGGITYCTCETAAATAAKVATVVSGNFTLFTGATVIVKFTNSNSATSPTLKVGETTAKPIYRYGTTKASSGTTTTGWVAGAIQMFTYDGTGWVRDYWNNTTYSVFTESGSSAKTGLVPKPSTTAGTTKFLREDATWAIPSAKDLSDTEVLYFLNATGGTSLSQDSKKDLNSIIQVGIYNYMVVPDSYAYFYTPDNHPDTEEGLGGYKLIVEYGDANTTRIQTVIKIGGNDTPEATWRRIGTIDFDEDYNTIISWTPWQRFFTTGDTIPIANGGTGVSSMTGTDYTTNRPRGIILQDTEPDSVANGCIVGVYE